MPARELWLRITYPFRRRRLERELRQEIDTHIALRADQLVRDGHAPADAAFAARRRFGNQSRILAIARATFGSGWQWLDGFDQDLRYVARQPRRSPGVALVVCLTIALGIAVSTTAFTFYDAIALKPLGVADAGSVIRVVQDDRAFGSEMLPYVAYDVLHREAHAMHSVVATTSPQSFAAILPGHAGDDARVVNARFVTPTFARQLRVRAALGRWFDPSDDHAAVLDHGFWRRTLDADPSVIGRRIRVGDVDLTIAGVAPPEFAGTGMPSMAPDLWMPASVLRDLIPRADWLHDTGLHWQILGRVAPGASLAEVNAEVAGLERSIPDSVGKPMRLVARRATFFQTDAGEFEVFQQVSVAFMVALTLILGIAAVNLVNVVAARNAGREREVSIRLALGASRARVARQLVSESVLLAIIGGVLGLAASRGIATYLRDWIVATMTSVSGGIAGVFLDVAVDWRVATYAIALSVAIGLGVGLWPALRAARGDVNGVLRQGGTTTAGARVWGQRNILLAVQVAGSLVLLTAAGMLLGGMRLSRDVDPGFDADHMLVVDVGGEAPAVDRAATRAEVGRRIADLPDVRAVSWTQRVPFGGTHLRSANVGRGRTTISIDEVSERYFDAMGMTIVRGRAFTREEVAANAPVMIVSETLARLRWHGADPVGHSVPPNDILGGPDTSKGYTVIGVVRDIRSNFLSRVNGPSAYYPYGMDGRFGAFLVRTRGAPMSAMHAIRAVVASISPLLSSRTHVLTMRDGPMALQRLMAEAPATVALALALAGLALASVGVYGLISQIVARRTREIGVHIAIGAPPSRVIWLVARKTLRPVMWGTLAGGFGAIALSFFLRALVSTPDVPDLTFGAGAFNPLVFLDVLGTLMVIVVAACWVPARRAAMLDPTVALRAE